jgi:hypothetical protein
MFTEASHAFSLAVIGLRDHASLADLTAVGRLADILHLTRAYWLAQAIMLYADLCDVAAPVLVQHDWEEIIATAEARLRPLSEEADRRYQQGLHRGIHPGL